MFEITKITESEQNDGTPKARVYEVDGLPCIDFEEMSNNITVRILLKDGTTEEQAHKFKDEINSKISGISIQQLPTES
jgi:hypothetical protein